VRGDGREGEREREREAGFLFFVGISVETLGTRLKRLDKTGETIACGVSSGKTPGAGSFSDEHWH
jgi:hypothetical protein